MPVNPAPDAIESVRVVLIAFDGPLFVTTTSRRRFHQR